MSLSLAKTKAPFNIITATSGSQSLAPVKDSIFKVQDNTVLTGNFTFTLNSTNAGVAVPDGTKLYLSMVDVDFATFTATVQDATNTMNTIVTSNPSTFFFQFTNNRWYRIV